MREWLKSQRVKQNFTQEQVAEMANISQQHYCDIECGNKNASVRTAKAISNALGFNWQKFFE